MNHVQHVYFTIILPLKYQRILLLNLFKRKKNLKKNDTELQIAYFKVLYIKPPRASLVITVDSARLASA